MLTRDSIGAVVHGRVRATGEPVAVRLVPIGPETAAPWLVDNLAKQWNSFAAIRHPALISARDLVVREHELGLVTDLADGVPLRRRLTGAAPVAPAAAAGLAADMAGALAALHSAGIVYGAANSENILVAADDDAAWLTDLATARLIRMSGAAPLDPPAYAAPELIDTRRRTPATDVYALGVVLYEMLTGVRPEGAGSVEEALRRHAQKTLLDLPSGLRYVLRRCLVQHPTDRPPAAAVAADLQELRKQLTDVLPPARLRRDTRRYRPSPTAVPPPNAPPTTAPPVAVPAADATPTPSGPSGAVGPTDPVPGAVERTGSPGRVPATGPSRGPVSPAESAPPADPPAARAPEPAAARAAKPGAGARHAGTEPPRGAGGPARSAPPARHREHGADLHPERMPAPLRAPGAARPVPPTHHSSPSRTGRGGTILLTVAIVLVSTAVIIGGLAGLRGSGDRGDSAGGPGRTTAAPAPTGRLSRTATARPTLDPAGREHSPEGSAAFVSHWFRTLAYATSTGDVSAVAAISDPDCADCQRAMDKIRQSYANGGSLEGGSYTIRSVVPVRFPVSKEPVLDVVFDRSPRNAVGPGGDVRASLPGASFIVCRALVTWTSDEWRMLTVTASSPIA